MQIKNSIKRIWQPEVYHGKNKTNNFFEGWYYKNISENGKSILSIIPGIIKSKDKSNEHAFIQFIDGKSTNTHFIKFDKSEFTASENKFEVNIENCFFNEEKIYIDIDKPGFRAFGELNFMDLSRWDKSFLSPGVMGRYSFVPFMECNHGIISMNHHVKGKILINKNIYLFTFGRGYIEKDWGRSFPEAYIWMQSNNFQQEEVSFFCSIAKIPWFGSHFRGFICGLQINNQLYKFATYTGAKIQELKIEENKISAIIRSKYLEININAEKSKSGILRAPYHNIMESGRVNESLLSIINVDLYSIRNKSRKLIFQGQGRFAGLEIVGDLNKIYS